MKQFFKKVIFGLCIPLVVFIITVINFGIILDNYNLSIIDKHRILAETKSPKIVLAGGSNLALGVDSAAIGSALHVPVVNTAVHAGFGLGRILDDVSPFLCAGDTLVVIPEYEQFSIHWNGTEIAYDLIFDARQYRLLTSSYYDLPPDFFAYFKFHSSATKVHLKTIWNNRRTIRYENLPPPYSRSSFNEYGDNIGHLELAKRPFPPYGEMGSPNKEWCSRFFRFVDDFRARGITVMVSYPGFEEESFRNSAKQIQELDGILRTKENLRVISTPKDFCFPRHYFFDTPYHPAKEGRAARTEQLIKDLIASGQFTAES